MELNGISHYLFIAIGVYCVIRGLITITTGKVTAREEEQMKEYSAKGVKKYKIYSAISNIVGGLICIAFSIVRMMNLLEPTIMLIICVGVIVLLLVFDFAIKKSCREEK